MPRMVVIRATMATAVAATVAGAAVMAVTTVTMVTAVAMVTTSATKTAAAVMKQPQTGQLQKMMACGRLLWGM